MTGLGDSRTLKEPATHSVWTLDNQGEQPRVRHALPLNLAVGTARRIARSSRNTGGAISVWVEDWQRRIEWAAGEKAEELREHGFTLDHDGNVTEEA